MRAPERPASHTEREIWQQPEVWLRVYDLIRERKRELEAHIGGCLQASDAQILLTGAGSSAFIGEALQFPLSRATGRTVRAIATTDLVTHPEIARPSGDAPTLVISFARSGNSPESVAAVRLLDRTLDRVTHLFITCNADGALARMAGGADRRILCLALPDDTNDRALAMTSSFSSMLLAALLCCNLSQLENCRAAVHWASQTTRDLLGQRSGFQAIGQLPFTRAVFLGSGPLLGIAKECHLKLQELSDGRVIGKYDSFLGFRHGPRAVVDDATLLVYLLSPDPHTARYERDLTENIRAVGGYLSAVYVGNARPPAAATSLCFSPPADDCASLQLLPYVIVGQLIGLYKALDLRLNPDNPSANGAISRVVEGVTIYQ